MIAKLERAWKHNVSKPVCKANKVGEQQKAMNREKQIHHIRKDITKEKTFSKYQH